MLFTIDTLPDLLAALASLGAARDTTAENALASQPNVTAAADSFATDGDLFLLADCEGHEVRARLSLQAGGLIDSAGNWIAPSGTTFVQLGDVTDRGPKSIALQQYFGRLATQAKAAGSTVLLHWGNHELLAARSGLSGGSQDISVWAGNGGKSVYYEASEDILFAQANPDVVAELASLVNRPNATGNALLQLLSARLYGSDTTSNQPLLAEYLSHLQAFSKLGSAFFVHGGVSGWLSTHAQSAGGLSKLGSLLSAQLRNPSSRDAGVANGFAWDISSERGGSCAPKATSPAWLDFSSDQPGALRDGALLDLLRNEGIRTVFCGHTVASHPRVLHVSDQGTPVSVSAFGQPTRAAMSTHIAYSVFCLDCGMGRQDSDRPNLYHWNAKARALRWLADDSVLEAN